MSETRSCFDHAAILNVDYQNDFVLPGAPYEVGDSFACWPKIRQLLDQARALAMPIYHVVRIYEKDGRNADLCRRESLKDGHNMVCEGSFGAEVLKELFPQSVQLDTKNLLAGAFQDVGKKEYFFYKPRWSAFYQTQFEDVLHKEGINTLIVVGCNYPNCPRASIYDASARDFRVVAVQDGISGLVDKDKKELTCIGVEVIQAQDLISSWIDHGK